jgi:radical SAM superfamily enzyme YgiQ (UPF0313 family)
MDGAFDYVCVGEGEATLCDLASALLRLGGPAASIPGLVWRDGAGAVVENRPRELLPTLDDLPFPARDLIDLDRYYQRGSIISSRGCPVDCSFCSCAAINGHVYRCHSVEYVLREVEHLITTWGCHFLDFHDDTFNLSASRVMEFCRGVRERGLVFEWGCFCRAAQLTQEAAQEMARIGCRVVQFGVEAGNDESLKLIKKRTSVRQIEDAVRRAAAAGIPQIVCGFIIGHPHDTIESIRETIDFGVHLHKLGATRLTLSVLTPYPGTPVYENREQMGISLVSEDWEQFVFSRVVAETSRVKRDVLRELYFEGIQSFLRAEGS